MQVRTLIHEIQLLPLDKRFFIMEQTLKSIKQEELKQKIKTSKKYSYDDYKSDKEFTAFTVSEKSLAKDWFSKEDNRWDNLL